MIDVNRTSINTRIGVPKIFCDENNNFNHMKYQKPIKLDAALLDLLNPQYPKISGRLSGVAQEKNLIKLFLKDLEKTEFLQKKVVSLVGSGSSAIAFETVDGDVLKLTKGNHFPLNRSIQPFDAEIFRRGRAGKTYYYVEEKLVTHGLCEQFVADVKKQIRAIGFRPYDIGQWDTHQIGFARDGTLKLLDPECAKYKTIFHCVASKVGKLLKRV